MSIINFSLLVEIENYLYIIFAKALFHKCQDNLVLVRLS